MLFNSYVFLLGFLPIAVTGWAVCGPRGCGALWLVASSLVFYGWWDPASVPLLTGSMAGNFVAGGLIRHCASRPRWRDLITVCAVSGNLVALFYYKYLASCLGVAGIAIEQPALPLGISFFTFTQIGYLLDARVQTVERSALRYALFVTFFPHLIAGPMLSHEEMMPQFAAEQTWRLNIRNVIIGSTTFLIGLLKKTMLADPTGVTVGPGFAHPEGLTLFAAWETALSYSLQLYFDFSGYSDMAIGLARIFNLRFPVNFNSPYKAESIIEYWQRWHMTLTRWLTQRLYNPMALAVSRAWIARGRPVDRDLRRRPAGFATTIAAPTLLTMTLAGVWHGSGVTFLLFGLLHGVYLCVNHAWRLLRPGPRSSAAHARVVRIALTYACVLVGSIVFRAATPGAALSVLAGMLGLHGLPPAPTEETVWLHGAADFVWLAALYTIVWFAPNTQQIMRGYEPVLGRVTRAPLPWLAWQPSMPWAIASGVAVAFGLLSLGRTGEFLYFQF